MAEIYKISIMTLLLVPYFFMDHLEYN